MKKATRRPLLFCGQFRPKMVSDVQALYQLDAKPLLWLVSLVPAVERRLVRFLVLWSGLLVSWCFSVVSVCVG